MNSSTNLVELHNTSISYPNMDSLVLDSISISFKQGEHVAIVGSNGAGKTTLLKKIYTLLNSQASFIHQNYALVPQLSVFHNIFMGQMDHYSTLYNIINLIKPLKKEQAKISKIISPLGITHILFKKVGELSGGQQQRTAIARALYRHVNIFLADEPVSAIDPTYAHIVLKLLTLKNKTTIASLHNIDLAMQYFDRIVGLRNKKILFDLPKEHVSQTLLSSLYT